MRTKKILSVLMVIFMLATMFGIVGAHAEEEAEALALAEVLVEEETEAVAEETPALAVEEPVIVAEAAAPVEAAADVEAAAAAQAGWDSNSTVILSDEYRYAGGWDQGLVEWNPFTASQGVNADQTKYTKKDSFNDFRLSGEAKAEWKAWYVDANGVDQEIEVLQNQNAAKRNDIAAYWYDTGSKLQLYIKMGKRELKEGETLLIRAQLTVIAPINEIGVTDRTTLPHTSEKITITLRSPKQYHDLIAKAQKVLDQGDSRYWGDWYEDLQDTVNLANDYKNYYPNQGTIDKLIDELNDFIADAPNHVKLTDWEWLNNLLGVKFIGIIWKVIDFFNFGKKFWEIISPAFTAIGNFFGAIFKIFGIFTPIFGLFSK